MQHLQWSTWLQAYFEENGTVKADGSRRVVLTDGENHRKYLELTEDGRLKAGRFPQLSVMGMAEHLEDLQRDKYEDFLAALAERGDREIRSGTFAVLKYVVKDVRMGDAPRAPWEVSRSAQRQKKAEEEGVEGWTPEACAAARDYVDSVIVPMTDLMEELGCTWDRAVQLFHEGKRPSKIAE